jgi:hypothetical protein
MGWDAPICVDSAACASGEWIGAVNCYVEGAAECVCHDAKAQGFVLRESHRRDPSFGLRIGGMAPTSHYGINLQAYPGQRNGAPEWPECPCSGQGNRTATS